MDLINQMVMVVLYDGQRIVRHEGKYKDKDDHFLYLELKGTLEAIPISKIIRIEILRKSDHI